MGLSQTFLKAFLLILNVILFLCGGIVMGIGIWAVVDKIYISEVIGNSLYKSAAILMVINGVFLILLSFLGCIGAISQNKIIVILYVGCMAVVFIVLITAAIIAAVFQEDIESDMREKMRKGIRDKYGYNVAYVDDNRELTEAWDLVQTRLGCCAVDDQGWGDYQQSRWFGQQFNAFDKKFVPPSCCVYEGRLDQYVNLFNCQSFAYGPPRFSGGGYNNALHYQGCYTAARKIVKKQADIIIGIGFSFCVFLITGIVMGLWYIKKLSGEGSADFGR
ncbi:23 kDa integral membrane protein-like [Ruditapes philippinarum]|uniref:23 kDa integral membrane protein-like n=1 Tax=Ruditapes philippinarum TaxID=129788 RepID=UPI00295AE925|nr:23 kDa integral membrane protein-like [Ruditapes philippinarum]XP_060568167.1 23 kDa integral membrane protein-like [Ruditapes philippinarum]